MSKRVAGALAGNRRGASFGDERQCVARCFELRVVAVERIDRADDGALCIGLGANRVGEDVTLTFGGESMVVGPRGEIHASLATETDESTGAPLEGFTVARIDLDDVRRNREEYQLIQNRQPTVYRSLVRRY